jgi:hypothetical protein
VELESERDRPFGPRRLWMPLSLHCSRVSHGLSAAL